MARRIIFKKNELSNSATPPSGYKYVGLDGEVYSEKDDDGSITAIGLLTGVSDVKLGGSISTEGTNWIWSSEIEGWSQLGVTVSFSVQSFIIDSQEQISSPTYFTYSLSSTSVDMVGLTAAGVFGTGLNPTNVLSSGYKLGIITEWAEHLNSLDPRFKFVSYTTDKLLAPNLDWSITIRRTFSETPAPLDNGYNHEYLLTYLSSNNTSVLERRSTPFTGGWGSIAYNPYSSVELSPFANLSEFK